jgi:hypothetical protein
LYTTAFSGPIKPNLGPNVNFEIVTPVGNLKSRGKTANTWNCRSPQANRRRVATIAAKRAARLVAEKLARETQIEATLASGGIYYGDSDRLVGAHGREAQVRNGRKVAEWRARFCLQNNCLSTVGLRFNAEGVRSKGEALAMHMIRWKAPNSIVAHSECLHQDGGVCDRSVTYYGKETVKVRDIDWWLSTGELYHVQVKGTASWFYRLKSCLIGDRGDYDNLHRFTVLRSELLNTYLYLLTNELLVEHCETEEAVLPMIFVDYRHIKEWFEYYLTEQSLLEKFRQSDLFVYRQLRKILKRAFPIEYAIVHRALKNFDRRLQWEAEQNSLRHPDDLEQRSVSDILGLFRSCLLRAAYDNRHRFDWSARFVQAEFNALDFDTLFPRRKRSKKRKN